MGHTATMTPLARPLTITRVMPRASGATLALLTVSCAHPGTGLSDPSAAPEVNVAPTPPSVVAPTELTPAVPTEHSTSSGSALSVVQAVCGDDAACRIDSNEPLALPTQVGRPHLVSTSIPPDVAKARGWGANTPMVWIVTLDDSDHVLAAQRLTAAFKQGHQPHPDELSSTFELTLPSGPEQLVTLRVSEPSPSGTAWGRNGFVRFSWPRFEPIEWEYAAFHYVNPSLNSTFRWSWVDRSGSSEEGASQFRFVLPELTLDERFVSEAWTTADFERCAARLSSKNTARLSGYRPARHSLLAVLSPGAELYLELEVMAGEHLADTTTVEVCFSGEVIRFAPETPTAAPLCDRFSVIDPKPASLRVAKAPGAFRYKVSLPPEILADFPGVTVILRDPVNRRSLMSSPFDFKTATKLGDVLQFSPDRVTCPLEGEVLAPRFAASNSETNLLDQLR
jgi:hypothetical protein